MSVIGREALPDVRDRLESPPGCPGVDRRPYQMSLIGRKVLPDVHLWSGDPHKCPGVVVSPSRMF